MNKLQGTAKAVPRYEALGIIANWLLGGHNLIL